ncbi:MAG: chorismate lyase [Pseudomonadota bacterium]
MSLEARELAVPDPSAWGPWPLPASRLPDADVIRLLRCEGSLTAALREHSGDRFGLRVLRQDTLPLGGFQTGPIRAERGIVREVVLLGGGDDWVFAQTIIPLATAESQTWITEMGGQPLGDALFHRDDVVRSPLSFARVESRQPLHQRACDLGLNPDGRPLFARRSCFFANDAPLLVTEVFLPALCPTP